MWVRLDDNFADDPVFDSVGPAASWLHVAGLCYSNRHLTDGFIQAARVGRLTSIEDSNEQVRHLVSHGVWQVVDGGYLIVHHLDKQFTREQVLLRRKKDAERVRRYRDKSTASGSGVGNGVTNGVGNEAPTRPKKTGRAGAKRAAPDPTPTPPGCTAPDCDDGWIGYDDEGKPVPCPHCRPHLRPRNAGRAPEPDSTGE